MKLKTMELWIGELTVAIEEGDERLAGNVSFFIEGEGGNITITGTPGDFEEVATFFEDLDHPRPSTEDLGSLVAFCRMVVAPS